MRKRCLLFVLIAVVIFCGFPAGVYAAEIPGIDDKAVFHVPESEYFSGDCVMTANRNLIRRAALDRGSLIWSTITNNSLRKKASTGGNSTSVKNAYIYEHDGVKYKIGSGSLTGDSADAKLAMLAGLLNKYPYGVVVWGPSAGKSGAHAVLAVGIRNTTVYAVDSTNNLGLSSSGIQKWKFTTMKSVAKCTKYWVITGISGKSKSAKKGTANSRLRVNGKITAPKKLEEGEKFAIGGDITSNYSIYAVSVKILDADGKNVISSTAKPNNWYYRLEGLDSSVKFGTLSPGVYTFKVTAKDAKKKSVLYEKPFRVLKEKTDEESTMKITDVRVPESLKKGQKFSISGTIRSNYRIRGVRIVIVDSNGNIIQSAKARPNEKKYDINKLDSRIKFAKLGTGTYRFKVRGTDSKTSKILCNRKFKVTK